MMAHPHLIPTLYGIVARNMHWDFGFKSSATPQEKASPLSMEVRASFPWAYA